jgi:ribose-phosphate pyrophosphokinase
LSHRGRRNGLSCRNTRVRRAIDHRRTMLLFTLDDDTTFAAALARALDRDLAAVEERHFEDGERKLRPLADPRGADAYVVHGLHGGPVLTPHDKLWRLLVFIATLRDHGAARVTAVLPYLAYARKDRQTKPFDPVTLRYVAQLFEAVGTQQVIVLEPHNLAAFQNAFRVPTISLAGHEAFDADVTTLAAQDRAAKLVVASPDPGGVKRAQLWREALESRLARPVGFAMIDKRRSAGVVSGSDAVAGDVRGATVLLLDDLIASGGTVQRAAVALREAGAVEVMACAAHGLFVAPAAQALADAAIDLVLVSDSVPPFRVPAESALAAKLRVASAIPLFARAIRDCHASWAR